jgi:hypothetical protein
MLPSGCNNQVLLKNLIIGYPDCINLTAAQKSIIAYLRVNNFDLLRVSAPSWRPFGGYTNHHANSNAVDFTADPQNISELFRAWEFMRRNFPGTVLLGVNDPSHGYTADIHLHISGTWNDGLYRHGFETKKNGNGIITNNHPDFRKVYAIAAKVYGWLGDYQDIKPMGKSEIGYTLIGMSIGAAIGFPKKNQSINWARFASYVAAGGSIGYIIDQLTSWIKQKID